MNIKLLSFIWLIVSCISHDLYAAQLSAVAIADNEKDARAESLRRLAESIQVEVKGETLVSSQFKDNVATQELIDSVKTSTELTLLGTEVSVLKTKQGYRAEAQLDTEQSFNLYLTKIKAEQVLLDTEILSYKQERTDLAKYIIANELTPKLSLHIKNYLVASMLAVKSHKNQSKGTETPEWLKDLGSKNQWLITLNNFLRGLASSDISEPKLAALLLSKNVDQENIFTCPIFQKDGSWLNKSNVLSYEIDRLLTKPSRNKSQAQYFFIGHVNKSSGKSTEISYQLIDANGQIQLENHVNYILKKPSWQSQSTVKGSVLTTISFEFKDKENKTFEEKITTQKQLYTLAEKSFLKDKQLITEDNCRPISHMPSDALNKAYGAESMVSLSITGSLGTFVLRPDPKEHEFALAKVTYRKQNLLDLEQVENRAAVGKKFPVLEPYEALMAAVETAFTKLY